MCGILGIVTNNRRKLLSVNIEALRNRGPDNVGKYVEEGMGFYHTRLAVIDNMETSNQPIVSACGNYVLICNGEIYNYQELKKLYRYDYQTTSDCEVITACYSKEGLRGLSNLKGMFAFALYDKKKGKIIVYRDAVGKPPLFYYQGKDAFIFSSSLTAIKDNMDTGFQINEEAVSFYMKGGYIPPDISFYKGITPLLPGFIIEIDVATKGTSTQYLTPQSASYDGFDYTDDQIIKEADRLLTQSLERRLQGLRHPVLLFSGGIDSTVLAKKISSISGKRLTCVALKPLIPFTNDEPYGFYAAKKLNLNYISVGFDWNHLMGDIENAISLLDQPLSLYSYFFLVILTRRAREFGNVLFLGEGGDEVFYGYSNIDSWFSNDDAPVLDNVYNVGPKLSDRLSLWGRKQSTIDLLGHSFVKVDKATAEQQMEARCPYLDWDLMYFVRGIPPSYFTKSKTTKIILKKLLNDFPHWFVYRKKIGFAFNFRYLMIPFYRYLYDQIDFEKLDTLNISPLSVQFSYRKFFENFDWLWRLYILSRLILNDSGRALSI